MEKFAKGANQMSFLIVGAGPCGLAMAKYLSQNRINYDQVDADSALGGNWLHGVYDTVYTDASKDVMQFWDFPISPEYPDFLSRHDMLRYLNAYARHFNLIDKIRFNQKVVFIRPIKNNNWEVNFSNRTKKIYSGVIICNGHHWDKIIPPIKDVFAGEFLHSKDYKTPKQLSGKKVLTIGSGNSAADIACEAARVSQKSVMSMRETPWIFPKSFMGVPLGRMEKARRAPAVINYLLAKMLIRLTFGKHSAYNLPTPNHKPFEKHPTVSEELPYYLRHGRIAVKPAISGINGKHVEFTDGSKDEFDMIVAATGFRLTYPFLPEELVRLDKKNLLCLGHSVYPDYKGLFFMGWQQVRGGIGTLSSAYASIIVNLINLEEKTGQPAGKVLQSMGEKVSKTNLFSQKEIFHYLTTHSLDKLLKFAKKMKNLPAHENLVFETSKTKLPQKNLRVY